MPKFGKYNNLYLRQNSSVRTLGDIMSPMYYMMGNMMGPDDLCPVPTTTVYSIIVSSFYDRRQSILDKI